MSKTTTLEDELSNDLLALSENRTDELIHNVSYDLKQSDHGHCYARAALGVKLCYVDSTLKSSTNSWWVLDQPELQIKNHILLPDLAAWKRVRLPTIPDNEKIECVPDWICEVVSSSTEQKDRIVKMPLYADLGVQSIWLVNPNLRILEAYQLENQRWSLVASHKEDDFVSEAPFGSIGFLLSNLWSSENQAN